MSEYICLALRHVLHGLVTHLLSCRTSSLILLTYTFTICWQLLFGRGRNVMNSKRYSVDDGRVFLLFYLMLLSVLLHELVRLFECFGGRDGVHLSGCSAAHVQIKL